MPYDIWIGTLLTSFGRWWQEGIESQAVDRVNRIGQKKDVHVYQLIAENTVESKVLDIQDKKKALIQQVCIYTELNFSWLTFLGFFWH